MEIAYALITIACLSIVIAAAPGVLADHRRARRILTMTITIDVSGFVAAMASVDSALSVHAVRAASRALSSLGWAAEEAAAGVRSMNERLSTPEDHHA